MTRTHLAAFVLGGLMITWGACTPSAELRLKYTAEVARCTQNERAIVDRQGTTEEADRTDLAAERERCDAALAVIEGAD